MQKKKSKFSKLTFVNYTYVGANLQQGTKLRSCTKSIRLCLQSDYQLITNYRRISTFNKTSRIINKYLENELFSFVTVNQFEVMTFNFFLLYW